jgi:RecA/RadA recombinase
MSPKKKDEDQETPFWKPNYDELVSEVSQSVGMTPVSMNRVNFVEVAISTGLLAYDLAVGGGFAPGRWCGQYGPEGGGKSTACASSIAEAQKKGVDSFFFDHEGSADPAYWSRIGVDLYGNFRDEEAQAAGRTAQGFQAGPHLMYYVPETAEQSLKFMSRLLQSYPDKLQYDDKWYYVFEDMKLKDVQAQKMPYDKKLYTETKNFWVPAEDGRAQGIFYIDSIAFMKPEALSGKKEKKKGEWKDESGAQALLARVFSKELKGITSLMLKKRFTIVATNQIREKPGVSFGNPEYAPGGNAVRHAHDNRALLRKRGVPAGYTKKPGMVGEEPCWDGNGIDRYNFAKLDCEKSKDFSPHRHCWIRWWFESNGRPGPGLDPVFDTFQFLKMTGQISKPTGSSKFSISLEGFEQDVNTKEFKALILDPENDGALREACWTQLREGDAFERFFDTPQDDEA